MSDTDDINSTITSIVRDIGKLEGNIDPDKDLYTDLGLESVGSLNILMELEERFDIGIDDNQFVQARTLNKIVGLVQSLVG